MLKVYAKVTIIYAFNQVTNGSLILVHMWIPLHLKCVKKYWNNFFINTKINLTKHVLIKCKVITFEIHVKEFLSKKKLFLVYKILKTIWI